MRIFTVSDLHADYVENLQWIESLSDTDYVEDLLILPGDVSDDLQLLARVFDILQLKFSEILFVPGNHELWVERCTHSCSLEKFYAVLELCNSKGVRHELTDYGAVSIVPLYSWYDFSFGEPDRYLRRAWRDFRACTWPESMTSVESVSDYFLQKNEPVLETKNTTVISFSHFLPRIDVMPTQIPKARQKVYPVLGSENLGKQVQKLNPDIHIYGHSHVNRSVVLDSINYVNNAYAYPSEERIARKQLHCVHDGAF